MSVRGSQPLSASRFAALIGISAVLFFLSLIPTELIPEVPVDIDFKAFFIPLMLVALLPVGRPTVAVALGVALGEGLRDLMEGYEVDDPLGFVAYIVAFIVAGHVIGMRPLNRGVLVLGALACAAVQAGLEATSFLLFGEEGLSVAIWSAMGNTITHGLIMGAIPLLFLVPALHGRFERHLGFAPKGQVPPRRPLAEIAAAGRNKPPAAVGDASRDHASRDDASRDDGAMVRVRGLWFRPLASQEPLLRGIDLSIRPGEAVGLLAPDGAGASVLCLCLAGVAPRDTGGELLGQVRVAGLDPHSAEPTEAARRVGLVTGRASAQITQVRPVDEVASVLMNRGQPREKARATARDILARVGLADGVFDRRNWELSEGEQLLVVLAAALAAEPAFLILDGVLAGLDAPGRRHLRRVLAEFRKNGAVLIAGRDPDRLLEVSDRILVMADGVLLADGPARQVLGDGTLLGRIGAEPPEQRPPAGSRQAHGKTGEPVLRTHGLSYRYDDGSMALDDVDLTVAAGQLVAVIGANGAGKTTLARLVAGLAVPTGGWMELAGRDTAGLDFAERQRLVGMAFADPDQSISERTVIDEIALPLRLGGLPREEAGHRAAETAARVGLPETAHGSDPTGLPLGGRKRVTIATALARGPRLLVLDEPALGLDAAGRRTLLELLMRLKADGMAVLVFDHHPDPLITVADRAVLLADGRVVAEGGPEQLFAASNGPVLDAAQVTQASFPGPSPAMDEPKRA